MKNKNNKNNRQVSKHIRGMEKSTVSIYNDPVPKFTGAELKFKDQIFTNAPTPAGTWLTVDLPSQGVASNNRVGDRAHLQCLEVRSQVYNASTTASSGDILRMIILQEKGKTAGAPATTDVLASAVNFSPYSYNARELYEVLYDESIPISYQWQTSQVRTLSLKPRIPALRFLSGTSTAYSGQIYILLICANVGSLGSNIAIRQWFEDSN